MSPDYKRKASRSAGCQGSQRQFVVMKSSAFTIIELLIVIAILAILAAVAVPQYQRHITGQKVQLARYDLGVIAAAAEDNLSTYGSYTLPAGSQSLGSTTLVNSRVLLNEISLSTSDLSPAPYNFNFVPVGSWFRVLAIPVGSACSGCPRLMLDSRTNSISTY